MITQIEGHNPQGALAALGVASLGYRIGWSAPRPTYRLVVDGEPEAVAKASLAAEPPTLGPEHPWYLIRPGTTSAKGEALWGKRVNDLRAEVGPRHVVRDLVEGWTYADKHPRLNFRLDPDGVNQPYAYRWSDPGKHPPYVNLGAQWLALLGIGLLDAWSVRAGMAGTLGWHAQDDSPAFRWPVWTGLLPAGGIPELFGVARPAHIVDWYESRRQIIGKVRRMSASIGLGASA